MTGSLVWQLGGDGAPSPDDQVAPSTYAPGAHWIVYADDGDGMGWILERRIPMRFGSPGLAHFENFGGYVTEADAKATAQAHENAHTARLVTA